VDIAFMNFEQNLLALAMHVFLLNSPSVALVLRRERPFFSTQLRQYIPKGELLRLPRRLARHGSPQEFGACGNTPGRPTPTAASALSAEPRSSPFLNAAPFR
jgi:hypothetical protein